MIKLGKLTDYAVVVLVRLSQESREEPCSAHALSEKTAIPEPTVAKVLKILAADGIVESLRGAAGGYRLARDIREISVADVITAMEGPIAITSCVEGSGDTCKTEGGCPVRGKWDRPNRAIRNALEGISLADMAEPKRRVFNITQAENRCP